MGLKDEMLEPLRFLAGEAMVDIPEQAIRVASVPVTQIVWRLVTGEMPSRFKGDNLPVESVSHDDCLRFVQLVNRHPIFHESGWRYRLPSSTEWTAFAKRGRRKFSNLAWTWSNSGGAPHPVAEKGANPFGLYDLFGNVWEWCSDVEADEAVCRGGCWCSHEDDCREVERWPRNTRRSFIGVRLIAEVLK